MPSSTSHLKHNRLFGSQDHVKSLYTTYHISEWCNAQHERLQPSGVKEIVHFNSLHICRENLFTTSILFVLIVTTCAAQNKLLRHLLHTKVVYITEAMHSPSHISVSSETCLQGLLQLYSDTALKAAKYYYYYSQLCLTDLFLSKHHARFLKHNN